MRYGIRRSMGIVLGAVALTLITVPPWGGTTAEAQNEALRGEYDLTYTRQCTGEGGGVGEPIALKGTVTYDGSGGGTFDGEFLRAFPNGIGPGIDTGDGTEIVIFRGSVQNCTVSYVVNPDGSFTQTFNGCAVTVLPGNRFAGGTRTLDDLAIPGQITLDGTVLLLRNTEPNIETVTFLTNPPCCPLPADTVRKSICAGSGVATSKR